MKRFLMLVGVAAVAAAMYVAAAPGSQQATTPTAKQFNALKKQVASLSKSLKALKKDEKQVKDAAAAAVNYIGLCFLTTDGTNIATLPVGEFGNTSSGFLFGSTASSAPRSALDVASVSPLAQLQEVNSSCLTAGGLKRLTHAGNFHLLLRAEHTR
jgi:putative Ca2+/H+ antiporter (TMEM165/GDT1 family)